MKKRVFALLLVAAMSFSLLAACGGKGDDKPENTDTPDVSATPEATPDAAPETPSTPDAPTVMDMTATYITAINNSGVEMAQYNPPFSDNDAEMAPMVLEMFGLTAEDVTDFAASFSMMNVHAYAIVLVKPAEGREQAVGEALTGYVDQKLKEFEQYLADQLEIVKKFKMTGLPDGSIVLVMCEGSDAALESIKATVANPVESVEPSAPAGDAGDLTETYVNAINGSGAEMAQYNPPFSDNDAEMAPMVLEMYGLTAEDVTDFAASFSMMNVHAYSIVLVKPAEGHEQAVVDALNGYVTQKQAEFERYLADQYEVAKAALVETLLDGTVALVMCQGADTVLDAIDAVVTG